MKKILSFGLLLAFSFTLVFTASAGSLQTLSAEKITVAAQSYLKKAITLPDYSLQLKSKLLAQRVPPGKVTLQVKPLTAKKWGGYASVPVQIMVNGKLYRTVFVTFNLLVYQKVVVTNQGIKQGEILQGNSVTSKRMEVSRFSQAPYTDLGKVIGTRASRYLPPNTILTKNSIQEVPLVLKNKPATLKAKVGAVEITTQVKALEDGKLGDLIQVQNLDSKKKIYATVTDKDLVEINKN